MAASQRSLTASIVLLGSLLLASTGCGPTVSTSGPAAKSATPESAPPTVLQKPGDPPAIASPPTFSPSPAEPSLAANQAPLLQVATWEQTQEIIASHKGKIVVLDLWSNFCPPCLEELPRLVKIHEEYGKDVVCLSLNCNFSGDGSPEDEREAVLKVLTDIKAPFLSLISADKDTDLYTKIGIASIPVIQVYDRTGKLRKQFDNEKAEYGKDGFTYQKHIVPFVAELVKEAGNP